MPRTVDPVERRASVAAAARAVLAREGFDGTTVRKVAAEAGSSTTAVTHYFADKEALLLAAIHDAYAALAARMRGHVERGPGGLPSLRAVLAEALPLDAPRAAESRVWLAFWSAAGSRPALRDVQRVAYREWRQLVVRLVAEAVAHGELAADVDPTTAAEQLMCLIDGLLLQATLEPDRLPPPRQVALLDAALSRLPTGS